MGPDRTTAAARRADRAEAGHPQRVPEDTEKTGARPGGESKVTVLVALGANLAVAVAKGVAAVLTGSASMAAETAHSFADTLNQVFLLIALKGSAKPADRAHPFGYGRVRYFWALLAAGSIFVTGALYSAFEGVHALTSGEHDIESPLINYVVLGVAFVLEGASLLRGLQQTRDEARQHRLGFRDFLRTSDDPTATTVVFEDSAALIGLVLAAAGNALHQVTGHAFWDGIASLAIAAVLAGVALRLGLSNKRLLTDVQADPRLVRAVLVHLGDEPEVEAVVDLLTLTLGTDSVLVCARLDLENSLSAAEVERAMVRIGDGVQEAFPDVAEVFLEPVPRHDQGVRDRVRSRYGDRLAEFMVHEASRS
ncbi:cation diffusion facilitator family transporter [Quadrisphaera setariae]|uniref:Cation diffusion facilitator family transporter n=1 Tax=Quadrisphaera setariae TaxID=2593304 RepID=A0A5C8Z5Z7_9ACTN|nr:cation diffusion facilitator family transporter [Quadrisphaera setariae]